MVIKFVPRKGKGTTEEPYEANTTSKHWQILGEDGSNFIIRIFDEEGE